MDERLLPQVRGPELRGTLCWVREGGARRPALLVDWRRNRAGNWEGLVATVEIHRGRDKLTVDWVPHELLERVPDKYNDNA